MADMEKSITGERDWSELLPDLIELIAKKLPDPLEIIRFRHVCKSWQSSAPTSSPPSQFPWLLDACLRCYDSSPIIPLRFYSVSSEETITVPIKKCEVLGTTFHYIPCLDELNGVLSLLNPLTNDKLVLPLPQHHSEAEIMPWSVWTSTGSVRDCKIFISYCSWPRNQIGTEWFFYDPQHANWIPDNKGYFKFCYSQGMLFSYQGFKVEVTDVSSNKLLYIIPRPKERDISGTERSYLVESSGEVLWVSWFWKIYNLQIEISIHRLDFGEGRKPRWVRICDIGDRILFLNDQNGFSRNAAFSTGFKGGCIYLIDPNSGKPYVHDVIAGTLERVPCPFEICTWFVPSL